MPETKWVLMDKDGKCIVKGKSRRYLVGADEKTRKEVLVYASRNDAISAIKRSYIICSEYVLSNYGEIDRMDIIPVEVSIAK